MPVLPTTAYSQAEDALTLGTDPVQVRSATWERDGGVGSAIARVARAGDRFVGRGTDRDREFD